MPRIGSEIWLEAVRRVWHRWPRYLATHIVATAIGVLILWPLFRWIVRRLVDLSGSGAITDFDIASFLLSPTGFLALVLTTTILTALLVFKTAAMMTIDVTDRLSQTTGVWPALRFIGSRARTILAFGLNLSLRIILMALPALAAGALVAWQLLTEHDINYYLATRPPEFLLAAGLIGLILFADLVWIARNLVLWSLALPLALFAHEKPRRAFERSRYIIRNHRPGIAAALAVWFLATSAITAIATGIFYVAGDLFVSAFTSSLQRLALALGLSGAVYFLVQSVAQAFASATFAITLNIVTFRTDPELLSEADHPTPRDPGEGSGLFHWVAAGVVGVIAISAASEGAMSLLDRTNTPGEVIIIAHRAGALDAPENTMAAVRQALQHEADWLEIDVQEISDGTVVVIHDQDYMRQSGDPMRVHEATERDIGRLDIGSWFAPEFAGERTITLDDTLTAVRDKATLLIEFKHYGHAVRLEEAVVEAVELHNMADQVIFMSLKAASVDKLKSLRPDWPAGLLVSQLVGDIAALDADFLAINANMARPSVLRRAHEVGKPVYVWTVNDREMMIDMLTRGVDGLITDLPGTAREVAADYSALEPRERLMLIAGSRLGLTGGAEATGQ